MTLRVEAAELRAVVAGDTGSAAELELAYEGPTVATSPLASGEIRRQIGLELRAKDTCNLVYVMWHVDSPAGIFVSVKSNPGASTHAECRDRGYLNLHAATSAPVPRLRTGERHTLQASIVGGELRVLVDQAVVWTGALPAAAFAFDGPSGVRSDNGVFDFAMRVTGARGVEARCVRR